MKTATGLTLIAIGAVLAFAVNGHPWFLNLQVVGWIIMVIGVAGMAIPRSGYGWLRRRVVTRRAPDGRPIVATAERSNAGYIMLNPAPAGPDGEPAAETAAVPETPVRPGTETRSWAGSEQAVPDEEVVEEYFPE